jgi:integrase
VFVALCPKPQEQTLGPRDSPVSCPYGARRGAVRSWVSRRALFASWTQCAGRTVLTLGVRHGRNIWAPAAESAALAGLKRHDLRSTCASLLFEAGATGPHVQAHLGHKDPALTLRVYTALTRQSSEAFRAALERAQKSRSGTNSGTKLPKELVPQG